MARPRRVLCLVPLKGADQFVSTVYSPNPPPSIDHCGISFHRTSRRTDGGYVIYRERAEPAPTSHAKGL